jgi:hypothetical protein
MAQQRLQSEDIATRAQECDRIGWKGSACYTASGASSAITGDPIVNKPEVVAILSPGGVAGSILFVRISG